MGVSPEVRVRAAELPGPCVRLRLLRVVLGAHREGLPAPAAPAFRGDSARRSACPGAVGPVRTGDRTPVRGRFAHPAAALGAGGAAAALAALAHGPRPAGAPGGQLRGTAPPRPLQREAAALRGQPEPLSAGQPRTTAPEQPRQPCVSQRGGLRAGASLPRPCCAVGGAPRGRGAVGSCPVNARLCPCVSSTIKTEHGGQHTGEWLLRRGCGAEGLPGQGSGRMGPRAGVLPLGAPTSQTAWSWDP